MDENNQNSSDEQQNNSTIGNEAKEGQVVGADGFSESDKQSGKALAIIAYLGVLALIPYFLEKNNKWVRFHTIQGINLMIWELIFTVVGFIPIIGKIAFIGNAFCLALLILGIMNVCKGEAKELPVISSFKFIKE